MAARGPLMAGLAKQLGHPRGVGGRLVGLLLNRGNRGFVSAAVQALQATMPWWPMSASAAAWA